jgi:integrase
MGADGSGAGRKRIAPGIFQLKSGNFWVRWRDQEGRRRSEVLRTKAAAEAFLRRKITDAEDIKAGRKVAPTEVLDRSPTLGSYVEKTFSKRLAECKHSERLSSGSLLKNHIRPRFDGMRMDEITGPVGREFDDELAQKGLSLKTRHNILALLTRVLRDAEESGALAKAPSFRKRKATRRQRRKAKSQIARSEYLDRDEFDALVAAASGDPILSAMVLVAGRAGLRSGELRALRWGDLDFKTGNITVRMAVHRGVEDVPKSGVGRVIPMGSRIRDAFEALPGKRVASALVFPVGERSSSLRLLYAGVRAGIPQALAQREQLRDHRRAARLRALGELSPEQSEWMASYAAREHVRFGWHILRHTFCSHLAINGTAVGKIQLWAGHESVTTTQRYMHLNPKERSAVAEIDALDQ